MRARTVMAVLSTVTALLLLTGSDRVHAHKDKHSMDQLKLFDGLFMEQVRLGDLLFHGDAGTEKKMGVLRGRWSTGVSRSPTKGSDSIPTRTRCEHWRPTSEEVCRAAAGDARRTVRVRAAYLQAPGSPHRPDHPGDALPEGPAAGGPGLARSSRNQTRCIITEAEGSPGSPADPARDLPLHLQGSLRGRPSPRSRLRPRQLAHAERSRRGPPVGRASPGPRARRPGARSVPGLPGGVRAGSLPARSGSPAESISRHRLRRVGRGSRPD